MYKLLYSFTLSGYEDVGLCPDPTMDNPSPGEPLPWITLTLTLEDPDPNPGEPTLWLDVMKQLSICNDKDTMNVWFSLTSKLLRMCVDIYLNLCE